MLIIDYCSIDTTMKASKLFLGLLVFVCSLILLYFFRQGTVTVFKLLFLVYRAFSDLRYEKIEDLHPNMDVQVSNTVHSKFCSLNYKFLTHHQLRGKHFLLFLSYTIDLIPGLFRSCNFWLLFQGLTTECCLLTNRIMNYMLLMYFERWWPLFLF